MEPLKLFISYSHIDEEQIITFKKHASPLIGKKLIDCWSDRKIMAGNNFQADIDNNLDLANIICLFISHNFISSEACKKEIRDALRLKQENGTRVICVILSPCAWLDIDGLSDLLAVPTDGRPICSFTNQDEGWCDVYKQLKSAIEHDNLLRSIKFSDEFTADLSDATVFKKAHNKKQDLLLHDIYTFPDIATNSNLNKRESIISSEESFVDYLLDKKRIVIKGDDQSGKTSLAKTLCIELQGRGYIPLYFVAALDGLPGNLDNMFKNAFKYQYGEDLYDSIPKEKIVPIIDDFHKVKRKDKLLHVLSQMTLSILIVDFKIGINFKDNLLLADYMDCQIKEFKPSLIDALIRRWISVGYNMEDDQIGFYKELDEKTRLISNSVGNILRKGIMPAYPFFMLSIISTYDTFNRPINEEITSQGYCYQALILYFLAKNNVANEELEYYVNFLTEFSYYLFSKKIYEISEDELFEYYDNYGAKYYTIERDDFFRTLIKAQLLCKSKSSNYSFSYQYIYYFFCGKYFSDNTSDKDIRKKIETLIDNLHVDENAYITIFISHHSRHYDILEDIKLSAMLFYDSCEPTTLSKVELTPFDSQSEIIIQTVLPESNNSERERYEVLKIRDEMTIDEDIQSFENEESEFSLNLRKSIKTVEVIGHIVKNRTASIPKSEIDELYKEAININLRLLSFFFSMIQDEKSQSAIIDFLVDCINNKLAGKEKGQTREDIQKLARELFWGANFGVVYAILYKTMQSLGSIKVTTSVIVPVCNKMNTPASHIIKHMCLMWNNKNPQITELCKIAKDTTYSQLARNVLAYNLDNYNRLNGVDYKDKDRLNNAFSFNKKDKLI